MKSYEILQKIIDEDGSCGWINNKQKPCHKCPIGGNRSCVNVVKKITGNITNDSYLEVAKKMLADIEVGRIILGEDVEE